MPSGLTCEEEDVRRALRRGDSTTLLATVNFVNVALTVIGRAFLEGNDATNDYAGLGHMETKVAKLFGNCLLTTAEIRPCEGLVPHAQKPVRRTRYSLRVVTLALCSMRYPRARP